MRAMAYAMDENTPPRIKLPDWWPPKYVPKTMVLLENNPFPRDVLCTFLLRPGNRDECVVIMPIDAVTDLNLARPSGVLLNYGILRPDDLGPVAFTIFHDGRVEINSELRGRSMSWYLPISVSTNGDEILSNELLARAARVPTTEFLGFGRAKELSAVQLEPD